MRSCVIFNPVARGNKARHFRARLDGLAGDCTFQATTAPGDARRLAAQAVAEGFERVVAAGGDGTVNEVLNGLGAAPDGFERVRFGVLPLGTVNVFARELQIPMELDRAWDVLLRGRETRMDLPGVEFTADGQPRRSYFVQMAGAGLDARAIELMNWRLKKKIGPFAYVLAGLRALSERQPRLSLQADGQPLAGEMALLGNGRFYGGSLEIFPGADPRDGLLEICVFPKVGWGALLRLLPRFIATRRLPEKSVRRCRAQKIELAGDRPTAFELDGEWAGHLPATFFVERNRLRVIVP